MKNLPIGIQSLVELRNLNGIYVDKTELIHNLVTTGKYYFFSRPRRFGKSLLISTLKELFKGNKTLFEDLWIEPHWDWTQSSPIIHISFDAVGYKNQSLAQALTFELKECAEQYGIELEADAFDAQFRELLKALSAKHGRIVLLIDEYDKPIIDYLEKSKIEQAKINRDTLHDFYSVLKSADEQLRFVFITGISKFSKVSLFSHLNNLADITMNKKYAALVGYTQQEVEAYFEDYLQLIEQELGISREELLEKMKIWYNGYSWDGATRVYNPFGTLNFLDNRTFVNFWFATGNPKFLIEQMREKAFYNIENQAVNGIIFEKFDIENIELTSLLFQTGYLTVKELGERDNYYVLDYPNHEVRESMYQFLIDDLAKNIHRGDSGLTMIDLKKAFLVRDTEQVREILNGILSDLPNEAFLKQTEGLFHGLVHIIFNYLGIFIKSEVHSSRGRADAIVETPTDVFIFEFKINKTAAEAMAQIEKKKYADKYRASKKTLNGIAFNYNSIERCIDEWEEKTL